MINHTIQSFTNAGRRISLADLYTQDWNVCIGKRRINKVVTKAAIESPMRVVVRLNSGNNFKTRRLAQNKINVFAGNFVECGLPAAFAHTFDWHDNVSQPDFWKNQVVGTNRKLQHAEK